MRLQEQSLNKGCVPSKVTSYATVRQSESCILG